MTSYRIDYIFPKGAKASKGDDPGMFELRFLLGTPAGDRLHIVLPRDELEALAHRALDLLAAQ